MTPTIRPGFDHVVAASAAFMTPCRGYVIGVCDFLLAHGYALFSDQGIRNFATGYLALVLRSGTGERPRSGTNAEGLIH